MKALVLLGFSNVRGTISGESSSETLGILAGANALDAHNTGCVKPCVGSTA